MQQKIPDVSNEPSLIWSRRQILKWSWAGPAIKPDAVRQYLPLDAGCQSVRMRKIHETRKPILRDRASSVESKFTSLSISALDLLS